LALEVEKKERDAALAEALETSRKAVEEATRLREWTMTVEEAASKAREEAAFYKEAAADLDKEKVLIKADLASAREAFQEMKVECVKGEIARSAIEEAKKKALEDLEAERVLGILNANRKIRKRTDTDVAFTREYSRVSIFHRERECTN